MNVTTVPEPSAIAMLLPLFLGWVAAFIVLLRNPKTRVAGIAVLAAPPALLMIAAVLWWFSLSMVVSPPARAWQPPHRVTRAVIDSDSARSAESDDADAASENIVVTHSTYDGPDTAASLSVALKVLFLLGGLLLVGAAAVTVLLVLIKKPVVGLSLLAVGGLALMLLAGALFGFRAFTFTPSMPATIERDAKVTAGIPVEAAKKVEAESAKPAARLPKYIKNYNIRWNKEAVAEAEARDKAATAKKPPDWVNSPPRVVGDSYQKAIVVGPYPTRQDCDAELPGELQKELNGYIELCVGQPGGTTRVVLPFAFLREEVVKGEWEEAIQSPSVGPMTQLHVLLQFDHKVKDRILEDRQRGVVAGRLWLGGGGLAGLLWLLAVIYSYLKIDLATGGAYRGRLRFAAALAILGPVAAAIVAVA
jgi:hypothetical protein